MKIEWDFSELNEFFNNLQATFDDTCNKIAAKIADELQAMLISRTPKKTGLLRNGWLTGGYVIERQGNGYLVTLLNDTEYAYYVNYGHYSYNQFNVGGSPYVVDDSHRTVKFYDGTKESTFVYGHFFVEKTILEFKDTILQEIILTQLHKWWESA